MKARRIKGALVLLGVGGVLLATSQPAFAEDLFDGVKPREFAVNAPYPVNSTMGGYAIYPGDGHWRVVSNTAGKPNNFGVSYGTLHLLQYDGGVYAAEMATTVNLNQSARDFYLTTNFCAGQHLVKVELVSIQGSEGSDENCLTIDPYVAMVSNKPITTLSIQVTNTQSAARFYQVQILINPAVLGFPNTAPGDWTSSMLAINPERKQLVDRMTAWAKQLQSAVKAAIAFSKPRDAFKTVPSWRVLAASTVSRGDADPSGGSLPLPGLPATGATVAQRLSEPRD